MNIGERIRFVRKLKKMTQLELAEKAGLGNDDNARTRISQYENGIRTPKEETLEKISEALGVTSLYLSTKEKSDAYFYTNLIFDIGNEEPNVTIVEKDGKYLLEVKDYESMKKIIDDYLEKKNEFKENKISEEDYQMWMINYTKKD